MEQSNKKQSSGRDSTTAADEQTQKNRGALSSTDGGPDEESPAKVKGLKKTSSSFVEPSTGLG